MKKLLAEEMSKEVESKRRSPNVIARLMGLDGLPPQPLSHKQHRRSLGNNHSRIGSVEKSPSSGTSSGRRSFRKSSREEQEFKDVFEVLDASRVERSSSNSFFQQEITYPNLTEAEMVFIRQKFMDAKRLSTDERLQDSKEFHDALEVLDSNKDLLLRFLQQPDSLFTKHLHNLSSPSPARCSHISTMTSSHAHKFDSSGLASKAEKESPRKSSYRTSGKHHCSLASNSISKSPVASPHNYAKVQSKGNDDVGVIPTRIVVLKPNLVKAPRTVLSPNSHVCQSNCRKHSELQGMVSRELEWGNKNILDDVGISRNKSRESREIAKEVTQKMRDSISSGSGNFSNSRFKGYAGDESSSNVSGSDSADEPEMRTISYSGNLVRHHRVRSSSSRSTESSVSREAKKRLSERWKVTHKSQDRGEISRSSTLAEMLAIPDREVMSANSSAHIGEGCSNKCSLNDGAVGWVEPLGISSRDGWKDSCIRSLSRSRSVPNSSSFGSSFGSPKASTRRATLVDDRYMFPKDTLKQERRKVMTECLHQSEVSCRNSRFSSKKSVSPRRRSRESYDSLPDIFITCHQPDDNLKEDDPLEQRYMHSEAFPSARTDTNSVPEHVNTPSSSESLIPEPSASSSSTGDSDISTAKVPIPFTKIFQPSALFCFVVFSLCLCMNWSFSTTLKLNFAD